MTGQTLLIGMESSGKTELVRSLTGTSGVSLALLRGVVAVR